MGQKTALDMIEKMPDYGGMSKSALLLHQKQCEDFEKMEKRMTEIEKKVSSVEKKVDCIQESLNELKKCLEKKSFPTRDFLMKISENKMFWAWLIVFTVLIFGASLSDLGSIFTNFGG